eukprot:m.251023 g.251023  ORF g.251023 m.251023 type:complete len:95 (+) comp17181_c10_seq1:37-321(+)
MYRWILPLPQLDRISGFMLNTAHQQPLFFEMTILISFLLFFWCPPNQCLALWAGRERDGSEREEDNLVHRPANVAKMHLLPNKAWCARSGVTIP